MSSSHGSMTRSSDVGSPRHAERPTRPRYDETGRATRFSRIRIARCAAAGRFSASPRGPSRHPQHSTFYRRCNSAVRPQSCRIHEESTPRPLRFPAPQHSHSAGHGPRCVRSSAVSARSRAAISWSRATMRGTRPVDRPGPGHVRETLSRAEAALTASAPAVVEPGQARCLRHEATGSGRQAARPTFEGHPTHQPTVTRGGRLPERRSRRTLPSNSAAGQ